MMSKVLLLGLGLLLVLSVVPGAAAGHYVPQAGDSFDYHEVLFLGNGTGNYSGYSESTFVNGTEGVTAVAPNGTESATYQYTVSWSNSTGSLQQWGSQGSFTFSASTFHYVDGTDNQTGYSNPLVWFYMNNSLPVGAQFYLLNTELRLDSTNTSYPLAIEAGHYVRTLFAQGNGSYQRNDVYGVFAATDHWKAYFDPSTGYIVGYYYTETDTDGSGDGFTLSDLLYVTSTTFTLTPGAAPPSAPASSSGSGTSTLEIVAVVVILLIIVIIVVALLLRSRSHSRLPKHPPSGAVSYAPPPMPSWTGAPPPVNLTPSQQPPVQQVVLREVVKVNCQYCGALMDSTARACPNCGAPRS
ncbi:MAG: zinc ribbon domain-containing protein [Thermoplasmata archaeon]